jgi:hypothetical protein
MSTAWRLFILKKQEPEMCRGSQAAFDPEFLSRIQLPAETLRALLDRW